MHRLWPMADFDEAEKSVKGRTNESYQRCFLSLYFFSRLQKLLSFAPFTSSPFPEVKQLLI